MTAFSDDPVRTDRIDDALASWSQGALILGELPFVHAGDPDEALTPEAAEASRSGLQALPSEVEGLVVITQTCDLVRSCVQRPFLQLAPLIPMEGDDLRLVGLGHRPRFATFGALASRGLVVDLDRIMTVEKSVVARCERVDGCANDAERRRFAAALARGHARFAFPDEFTRLVDKLSRRMIGKHEKDSPEGRGLRALREIRVQPAPDWEADRIELFFWFVQLDPAAALEEEEAQGELLGKWLALVETSERFIRIDGQLSTLGDMTASEYVHSDPLDLDRLSSRR